MTPAVLARQVSKNFGGRRQALSKVDLVIREGEIQGLLGPNGAGKTTLIATLVGLTTPDEGTVEIFGLDVQRNLYRVQGMVNMVRGFSGVLEKVTARELLKYYAHMYDAPMDRVDELLRLTGLWDRRHQEVALFSSGWRQRFFIAKGLINRPRVLFLDEPTVGLDVDAAMAVRELVRDINRQGCTILLTTHYMREAEDLCGSIALIADGRIVAEGDAPALKDLVRGPGLEDPTLEDVFLRLTRQALEVPDA
jgi:ABC-2 type transport system ATP-binding protein